MSEISSILALDLGTTFGYCYCPASENNLYDEKYLDVGSRRLSTAAEVTLWGKTRMTRRLDPRIPRFYNWLDYNLSQWPVDILVFEDVQFSSYTFQVQLWSSFRAVAWVCAVQHSVLTECLPVSSLKKFAGGGGLKKEGMAAAAASARFQPHPKGLLDTKNNSVLDDNAVDALHLCKWAFQNLRRTPSVKNNL